MKNLKDLLTDLHKHRQAIEKVMEVMPMAMGVEAVKVIKSNFKNQGYETGGSWKQRTAATNKSYDYSRRKGAKIPTGIKAKAKNNYKGSVYSSQRPILTQTGNLRDSVTYKIAGKKVEIGVFPNQKKGGATEEAHTYARKMNEGGSGKWGKNATHTPARQFMPQPNDPPTPKMKAAFKKKLDSEINKALSEWKK